MTKLRVLVVEDEPAIRSGLCDVLAFNGFEPMGVPDGTQGLEQALTGEFGLIILDVMLPGLDGFSICREVRSKLPRQAILMLTARGAEDDILQGFDVGADDYIAKPFSVAQLLARVGALVRRSGGPPLKTIHMGMMKIDPAGLSASGPDGRCDLSPREIKLLAYLWDRPGVAVSREELLREVWGFARTERVETRCVDMQVVKLRRKLSGVWSSELIETVRGAGYRMHHA